MLVSTYLPIAFLLGRLVRDCNWQGGGVNTSIWAMTVMRWALIVQWALPDNGKGAPGASRLYRNVLSMSILTAQQFHRHLKGVHCAYIHSIIRTM
jgi:hypothetical protein